MRHVPVLLTEVIENLALKNGDQVIDATVGDGGHSAALLACIKPQGKLLALDADPESLLRAEHFLYDVRSACTFVRSNFSELETVARLHGFTQVAGILMDLGWATPQFKERGRGFSFETDEPLDMRFTPDSSRPSAQEMLASFTQAELERVLKQYGEEPLAHQLAQAIVVARTQRPVSTTKDLVEIILAVYRQKLHSTQPVPWIGGVHPATRTFQALRIAVNRELEVLKEALPQALALLKPGGRLAVITFHSLEDRIVKHFFAAQARVSGTVLTKKPIIATPHEVERNPASRSAKLRIFQKK